MDFYKMDLDGLTLEQKRVVIFRRLIEEVKNKKIANVEDIFSYEFYEELEKSSDKELFRVVKFIVILMALNEHIKNYRKEDNGITEYFYPNLLNKMKKLADEFGLKNTLELSNLYTYLLWNGYLSKNKKNVYCIENRKLILGLFWADIMDGVGVCLNHADMLKDFLNICGYDASMMINFCGENIDKAYKIDIERSITKGKISSKISSFFMSPLIKKIGNHAFTLVYDNGKPYIYDSTNLMALEFENPYFAHLLNGTGSAKLKPYISTVFSSNFGEIETLLKLFELDDLSSPCSRKDFIITGENNIELFRKNIVLLDDFYDDARDSIVTISEITDKIKTRKK